MTSDNRICRVCFDYVKKHIVNKNIHGMLQTLLINIDISSSESSVMCTVCQEKLKNCYYFKKKCMFTEDTLAPFVNENVKINLNEIPNQIDKSKNIEEDKNICRLCLQYNDDDVILTKDEQEQFREFFPEINLNLTNFVVLCSTCYDMLHKYFLFVTLCSRPAVRSYKFPVDCDSRKCSGNNLEDCREFSRSAEEANEKKVVLLTEEVQIKTEEEEEQLCSSIDCSVKQINDIKTEKIQSNLTYTDNDYDKKLMLLHEELDIKFEDESSEKEFIYSNSGKKESNCKIQPNEVEIEKRGLLFNDLEELTCNTTDFRTFAEGDCKSQQENTKTDMHKCDKCDYESNLLPHLKNHMLTKHTDSSKIQMYECAECGYKTKNKQNLKSHILFNHTDISKCKKYKLNKNLKKGIIRLKPGISRIRIYKCEECDYKTKNKDNLKNHVLCPHTDSSKNKNYKCGKCDYKCKFRRTFKMHVLVKHSDPSKIRLYQCDKCDFKTSYKGNLKSHILHCHTDSSKSKKYKCDFKSKLNGDLKKQIVDNSDTSKIQMYACKECGFQTKYSRNLIRHVKKHIAGYSDPPKMQMYECKECDFKTKYAKNIKRHVLYLHTDPSKSKKYKCANCDFKCKSPEGLKRHLLLKHTDPSKIRMYECEECDFKTKSKDNLKNHIMCHHTDSSKSKIFKCKKCDFKSKSYGELKCHLFAKHSEIQIYECDQCDFRTKYNDSLKTHILCRHTNSSISEKYKCDKCLYKCKLLGHLKSHIFAKHSDPSKIQIYECEQCGFKTKYERSLKLHLLCRHSGS